MTEHKLFVIIGILLLFIAGYVAGRIDGYAHSKRKEGGDEH